MDYWHVLSGRPKEIARQSGDRNSDTQNDAVAGYYMHLGRRQNGLKALSRLKPGPTGAAFKLRAEVFICALLPQSDDSAPSSAHSPSATPEMPAGLLIVNA
jgi:hypothetical protein